MVNILDTGRNYRMKRKLMALFMGAALLAGCHELDGQYDISGLGTDSLGGKYAAIRDPDGQHDELCTYNVDPGCYTLDNNGHGVRVAYDAIGPNNLDDLQGRAAIWGDIQDAAVCGATDPVTNEPAYGWPGYGGYTPSTSACITNLINEIQDDPADPNDKSSWVCVSGSDCHAAYGSTAAGSGTADMTRTNWYRSLFTNTTQGRINTQDLIWAVRDFYLAIITDPSISGVQATGHPGCIQMADNPSSGAKVKLGRWCI